MGDLVNKVVKVGTLGLVDDVMGIDAARDAQRDAANSLQKNIQVGLDRSEEAGQGIQNAFNQGQRGSINYLNRGLNSINSGYGNAINQFGQQAGLFDPAAQNLSNQAGMLTQATNMLQQGATASGRGQEVQNILNDPNFQGVFDAVEDRTQNQLSSSGLRRSGAGAQMNNDALLNRALQIEGDQYARQGGIANMASEANRGLFNSGLQGIGSISQLYANQGGAQGNMYQNLAAQNFAGGSGLSQIQQQQLANELNLIGQQGKAEAAGITGPAMTTLNANQGILNAGLGLSGALLGNPSFLAKSV